MSTQKGTLINKYTPNYVIFDLETTGISPNYDEVIEISALKVKGGEVVDEFNTLVNPGRKIPFGATKVNGITNAMVAEAPAFSHVLAEFLDFAEGLVLVGHNIARFAMKFIWRDAGGAKAFAADGASSSGGSGGALWYFIGRCASSTE